MIRDRQRQTYKVECLVRDGLRVQERSDAHTFDSMCADMSLMQPLDVEDDEVMVFEEKSQLSDQFESFGVHSSRVDDTRGTVE